MSQYYSPNAKFYRPVNEDPIGSKFSAAGDNPAIFFMIQRMYWPLGSMVSEPVVTVPGADKYYWEEIDIDLPFLNRG